MVALVASMKEILVLCRAVLISEQDYDTQGTSNPRTPSKASLFLSPTAWPVRAGEASARLKILPPPDS